MNMNQVQDTNTERPAFVEAVIRTGKLMGGLAIGGATGYAMSKGIQEIIPVDADLVSVADAVTMGTFGIFGAFLATEASR